MAAAYGVRLIDCGPNRLGVSARVRPLLRLAPADAKARLAAGPVVLVVDVGRHAAEELAADLARLGAAAEVFVTTPCPKRCPSGLCLLTDARQSCAIGA